SPHEWASFIAIVCINLLDVLALFYNAWIFKREDQKVSPVVQGSVDVGDEDGKSLNYGDGNMGNVETRVLASSDADENGVQETGLSYNCTRNDNIPSRTPSFVVSKPGPPHPEARLSTVSTSYTSKQSTTMLKKENSF
ncbi:hypothetical protein HDU76_008928, partial [Blyttiomyces sp. JEL0837]